MRKWIVVVGAVAIAWASIGVETGRGQGGGTTGGGARVDLTDPNAPASVGNTFVGRGGGGTVFGGVGPAARADARGRYFAAAQLSSEAREFQNQMQQLTQRLREAKDEATKADLTKQLETAVDKYFDEDMKSRETQLSQLEERVTKLRAQLDRRRKAKDEITKLQTKVLVNDADGLGFGDLQPEVGSLFHGPVSTTISAPQPTLVPNTFDVLLPAKKP